MHVCTRLCWCLLKSGGGCPASCTYVRRKGIGRSCLPAEASPCREERHLWLVPSGAKERDGISPRPGPSTWLQVGLGLAGRFDLSWRGYRKCPGAPFWPRLLLGCPKWLPSVSSPMVARLVQPPGILGASALGAETPQQWPDWSQSLRVQDLIQKPN